MEHEYFFKSLPLTTYQPCAIAPKTSACFQVGFDFTSVSKTWKVCFSCSYNVRLTFTPLLTSHICLIQNRSLLPVILTRLIWETSPVLQPITDFWVFHTWSPAVFMLHQLNTTLQLLFTSITESIPSPLFPLRTEDSICWLVLHQRGGLCV